MSTTMYDTIMLSAPDYVNSAPWSSGNLFLVKYIFQLRSSPEKQFVSSSI